MAATEETWGGLSTVGKITLYFSF